MEVYELLTVIGICVVLPVLIVWMALRTRQMAINKKTEVMLKAIESGATLDPDLFKPEEAQKTWKEKLLGRLTGACITSFLGIAFLVGGMYNWDADFSPMDVSLLGAILLAIGIALFIVYFVGRKMLAKEIEAEEKALDKPKE